MIISENFPYTEEFFRVFTELCIIPHGSGNTTEIAEYCVKVAKENGCEAVIDKAGNVIIKKTAGRGYEHSAPVIVQGHLDMVCEKTPDSDHDFTRDPLKLKYDGKYISAENTTLGGDDGIAVAYALALVKDKETPLPPLEILLTADEETGLYGAFGLDSSMITGKMLINLDSEEEGILLCGCAGGLTAKVTAQKPQYNADGTIIKLSLTGLAGGHSGAEIHKRRLNAAKAMSELISSSGVEYQLISFVGGGKNNAIPCNCTADICVAKKDAETFIKNINASFDRIKKNAVSPEDKPSLEMMQAESHSCHALSGIDSRRVIGYICNVADGVIKTCQTGVISSLNIGISTYQNGVFYSETLIRSMVNSDLDLIFEMVAATAEKYDLCINTADRYPAWEYEDESPLREKMVGVFEKLYGRKPVVSTIHAGLECGIISDKIEGMDAVSIGPDILDVHTVNERLDAASAVRVWEYLSEILKSLK